jgi:hypothetical protein
LLAHASRAVEEQACREVATNDRREKALAQRDVAVEWNDGHDGK